MVKYVKTLPTREGQLPIAASSAVEGSELDSTLEAVREMMDYYPLESGYISFYTTNNQNLIYSETEGHWITVVNPQPSDIFEIRVVKIKPAFFRNWYLHLQHSDDTSIGPGVESTEYITFFEPSPERMGFLIPKSYIDGQKPLKLSYKVWQGERYSSGSYTPKMLNGGIVIWIYPELFTFSVSESHAVIPLNNTKKIFLGKVEDIGPGENLTVTMKYMSGSSGIIPQYEIEGQYLVITTPEGPADTANYKFEIRTKGHSNNIACLITATIN